MWNCKNTKKQGDIGVGRAICWFVENNYTVCIPLTDSQDYDLIVEKDGNIQRVQVKTTSFKSEYGIFYFQLSVKGGNRTNKGTVKKFDNGNVDAIFVATVDGNNYLFPSKEITAKHGMSLGPEKDKYKVI